MVYPKVDFKGYEKEVANARRIIQKWGGVFVVNVFESGFIFSKEITDNIEHMLETNKANLIGFYRKPLRSPDIIEDLEFEKSSRE